MNSFDFLQQMNGISPEYIEESLTDSISSSPSVQQSLTVQSIAEEITPVTKPKGTKSTHGIIHSALTYTSLAACLLLAVGAAFLFRNLHQESIRLAESSNLTSEQTLPIETVTAQRTEAVLQTETVRTTAAATASTAAETTSAPLLAEITELTAPITSKTEPEVTEPEAILTVTASAETTETETQPAVSDTVPTVTETEPVTTEESQASVSQTEPVVTTTAETEPEPEATQQVIPYLPDDLGDLDSDGMITEADGAILYCICTRENIHGKRFVSDELFARADLNTDGVVNYADQVALMRYLAVYWYGGYRDLTLSGYMADVATYNQIYLDIKDTVIPADFGDLWQQAAFVLTINEAAMDKNSSLTYETRSPESEDALQTVRNEYLKLLEE